jgi:hypothetical protein
MALTKQQAEAQQRAQAARIAKKLKTLQTVKDAPRLLYALADRDDFRAVVIGQAWIENTLVLLAERYLHLPDELNLARMSYDMKLSLAAAFQEVRPTERGAFKALGKLRNKLAHHLDEKLEAADADEIMGGLQEPKLRALVVTYKSFVQARIHARDQDEAPPKLGPPTTVIKPLLLDAQVTVRAVILLLHAFLHASLDGPMNKSPGESYADALRRFGSGGLGPGLGAQ